MRIISFAKTWRQYVNTNPAVGATKCVSRRFKTVWFDGEHFYSKHPKVQAERRDEFRKVVVPSWWNHTEGEPTLVSGEVFEGVEWGLRVGPRYVCDSCGWVGGKATRMPPSMGSGGGKFRCQNKECAAWSVVCRGPRRGVLSRHLETRIEMLGEPLNWSMAKSDAEAAREGFPDMCFASFLDLCFPGVPLKSQVARVAFKRVES